MPTTNITYYIQHRPVDVREETDNEGLVELANETIQHFDYDDLRAKIRERFKQLLESQREPLLFDLLCDYYIPDPDDHGNLMAALRTYTLDCTREIYNQIDWEFEDNEHAYFVATYYTLQGTEESSSLDDTSNDASSDAISIMDSSRDSLGCVLKRLDHMLERSM